MLLMPSGMPQLQDSGFSKDEPYRPPATLQATAQDGNALGATSQWRQAGQQVGLKGPHGLQAQLVIHYYTAKKLHLSVC